MVNAKLLIICLLILNVTASICYSQDCISDLKTEVKNATPGSRDGKITFKLDNGSLVSNQYQIFEVTAVSDTAGKRLAVENGELDRLRAGNYEFLVIDRRNKKCFKEILVQVKEQ